MLQNYEKSRKQTTIMNDLYKQKNRMSSRQPIFKNKLLKN